MSHHHKKRKTGVSGWTPPNDMFQRIEVLKQNTVDYYKQHGLSESIKRFFEKLGFEHFRRTLLFLVLDLKDLPDNVQRPYSFHIETADDIQEEENDNYGLSITKKKARDRLQKGHRLFALKEDSRMAYVLWAELKRADVWWFDNLPIHLPHDAAYISGAYTMPEFRGRGIASKLKKEIFHYLKKEGYKTLFAVVSPINTTAVKINKRLGFRAYQIVRYSRYWHIRHYSVQKYDSDESRAFITLFKAPKDIWKTFL